jgi:hypothetical protein
MKRFRRWLTENDDVPVERNNRDNHLSWDQGDTDYEPNAAISNEPNVPDVVEDASQHIRDIHSPIKHSGDVGNDTVGDNSGSTLKHTDNLSMNDHAQTFTPDHRNTLNLYKSMSPHINTPLRTGQLYTQDDDPEDRITRSEHATYTSHMDHITSHVMPTAHVTFRGATKRYDFHKMKPGDHIIDHGYTGTTHSPDTAHDFSSKMEMPNGEMKHKLFRIHMPAGTKAYHLDRHENDHQQEQETLLHRGTKFLVGNHHSYDNHHVVDLHVVDQGHDLKDM